MCEMPKYKSYKVVHALKIKSIELDIDRANREGKDTHGGAYIIAEEEDFAEIMVDAEYVKKHNPKVGGYYVVYDGGYKSWSPADAFEGGYTKI